MGLTKGNLNRQLTVGGATFDWDPIGNPNDIQLLAYCGGGANVNTTARQKGAAAGYPVPAGKTLHVVAMKLSNIVAIGFQAQVLISDNDVGQATNTAFTNPVYHGGSSGLFELNAPAAIGATAEVGGIDLTAAATKFVSMFSNNTAGLQGTVILYCKLV